MSCAGNLRNIGPELASLFHVVVLQWCLMYQYRACHDNHNIKSVSKPDYIDLLCGYAAPILLHLLGRSGH